MHGQKRDKSRGQGNSSVVRKMLYYHMYKSLNVSPHEAQTQK